MRKLKPLEIKEHNLTRNNDSNLSNILNKKSLNQTNTTDYSLSQEISQNDSNKKNTKEKKTKKSKPLISITTPEEEIKQLNKKRSEPNLNANKSHLPTNVNEFNI